MPAENLPDIHNPKNGPEGPWTWMCIFDGGSEIGPMAVSPDLVKSWLIGDQHSKPIPTNDMFATAPRGSRIVMQDGSMGTVICNGLKYGKTIVKLDEDEPNALQQILNEECRLYDPEVDDIREEDEEE